MFYRMTKTKKADWEEVEDRDPVPVYRDKPMYRKRLPKQKKIVKIPPKKPKRKVIDLTKKKKKTREIIDLTDDRDDEKLAVIERDEKEVDYYFESASDRAERIEKMDRQVIKADPQTNNISKKREAPAIPESRRRGSPAGNYEFPEQPALTPLGHPVREKPALRS